MCTILVVLALLVNLAGCANMSQEQQGAATGAAIGAALGGLVGYAVGGEKGALIGAGVGAGVGALSGWAYAKRQEAIRQAALANQRVEFVNETKTERVVAEPVAYETVDNVKYAKVRARTYQKDPKTQQEKVTSDTYERVPLE